MKLNTRAAKHLIKKARPVQPTEACQIGRLDLVFLSLKVCKNHSTVWLGRKMNCKGKDLSNLVLGIHICNPLLEMVWLILIYLNKSVDGKSPRRKFLSLLKCIHPTFSAFLYCPAIIYDFHPRILHIVVSSMPDTIPCLFFRLKTLLRHHTTQNLLYSIQSDYTSQWAFDNVTFVVSQQGDGFDFYPR